jgi:hypothetical protein
MHQAVNAQFCFESAATVGAGRIYADALTFRDSADLFDFRSRTTRVRVDQQNLVGPAHKDRPQFGPECAWSNRLVVDRSATALRELEHDPGWAGQDFPGWGRKGFGLSARASDAQHSNQGQATESS